MLADSALDKAKEKGLAMLQPPAPTTPLVFSEFGTRRRRSFQAQDIVIRGLIEAHKQFKDRGGQQGALAGTSNVRLPSSLPSRLFDLCFSGLPRAEIRSQARWDDRSRVDHGHRLRVWIQGCQWKSNGYVGGRSARSPIRTSASLTNGSVSSRGERSALDDADGYLHGAGIL